ncbi:hypothetical protein [Citrobacter braakii]|uniref:hypothetical protein n=1 Tax=Citrobacter braakii TaxID=57706 RepID=UPI003789394A
MILMILAPLIGVMGAILLSFGVWMIYPPGGLISAGMLCLIWSWLVCCHHCCRCGGGK